MIDEWIKTGAILLSLLFSIGQFIYTQIDRRNRATTKSIDELKTSMDKRFDDKCLRLSRLEADMSRNPSRQEFELLQERNRNEIVRIHERIDELNKNSQTANLMLGQVLGELKQMSNRLPHD
jgi:hypothetical protein